MVQYERAATRGMCPVCRTAEAERLYGVTASEAAQHFVRREADATLHEGLREEIERLWGGNRCEILRCKECGFIYAYPYVAGKEAFYGMLLGSPSYPQQRFEFDATYSALKKSRECGASGEGWAILEVGAGNGAFIRRVVPDLFRKENVLCTEFSSAGMQAIQKLGVECIMSDVRGLANPRDEHRFSAVCMFQVLEHLDGLDELWEAFNRLTTARAHLFLSVPNDRWIEFQEQHCGLLDMPPNHVGRWNRKTFETMGGRYGWRVEEYATEPCGRREVIQATATARFFGARSRRGSITDRMTRIENRHLRRAFSIPALAGWYVRSVPLGLMTLPESIGPTQWIHLQREG